MVETTKKPAPGVSPCAGTSVALSGDCSLLQNRAAGGLALGRALLDPALALAAVVALAVALGGLAVGRALAGVDAGALDGRFLGGLHLRRDAGAHREEGGGSRCDGNARLDLVQHDVVLSLFNGGRGGVQGANLGA